MDDYIIKQGEYGNDMYFIERGTCHITINEKPGEIIKTKTVGDYFGEMGVLTSVKRSASVREATVLEQCSHKREDVGTSRNVL